MASTNSSTNKTNLAQSSSKDDNILDQVNKTLVDETADLGALAKSIAPEQSMAQTAPKAGDGKLTNQ